MLWEEAVPVSVSVSFSPPLSSKSPMIAPSNYTALQRDLRYVHTKLWGKIFCLLTAIVTTTFHDLLHAKITLSHARNSHDGCSLSCIYYHNVSMNYFIVTHIAGFNLVDCNFSQDKNIIT